MDARVRGFVMACGRDAALLESHDRLDEARHAGDHFEMADVALDGPEGAVLFLRVVMGVDAVQGLHFEGIAQIGARAMAFHIGDAGRIHAAHAEGLGYDLALPLETGGGVGDLGTAVIIDGRAENDRVNGVTVLYGVLEAFQENRAHAVAGDDAFGGSVIGAAVAVRGKDHAFLVEMPVLLGNIDAARARDGHVALAIQEALAAEMQGHQGSRAGALHREGRASEVELVGDARAEVIPVRADMALHETGRAVFGEVGGHEVDVVGAQAGSAENSHGARVGVGIIPRVLQGVPAGLEKKALLGIHMHGFRGRVSEKSGVEEIGAVYESGSPDVIRVVNRFFADACPAQFVIGKEGDALLSLHQVVPVLFRTVGFGKTAVHADDGDGVFGDFSRVCLHVVGPHERVALIVA